MPSRPDPVEGAPRPGDPASDGPRPDAGWRDLIWAAVTGATLAVALALGGLTLSYVAFSGEVQVTGGVAVLGFLATVASGMIVFWVAVGAWRRTVYGCPFDHRDTAPWERRCRRHELVGDPDPYAARHSSDGPG